MLQKINSIQIRLMFIKSLTKILNSILKLVIYPIFRNYKASEKHFISKSYKFTLLPILSFTIINYKKDNKVANKIFTINFIKILFPLSKPLLILEKIWLLGAKKKGYAVDFKQTNNKLEGN